MLYKYQSSVHLVIINAIRIQTRVLIKSEMLHQISSSSMRYLPEVNLREALRRFASSLFYWGRTAGTVDYIWRQQQLGMSLPFQRGLVFHISIFFPMKLDESFV
ncbi:hypothetical protein CDAR_124131 [Caerostris darwini]|uniref:Uncharacterized protein n=1 Tax=Caerostris darwini TaxID=1538125 RepID=A0AAV4SUA0_9ARAC|nr:hypothetical protein CDAR_124131 [Caerostris darwini]